MMEEFLHNFHFIRPWLLLLLALPAVLYGIYFKGINAQSSWQKVIDERLLNYLLVKGSAAKRQIFMGTALAGLIGAVIAAAGPSWQKIEVPAYAPQNPVMVLLNLSSDMSETDLAPSRLSRAKYKIKDFLNMLKGVQAGLEVYSSEPFVIAPLTDDMNILQNLLPAVGLDIMPANGDRLDRAIDLAVAKIKSAGYQSGRIVVFTSDAGQKFDAALETAKQALSSGFTVNIIGVSAETNEKLALIAKNGGGRYWNLQADDSKIKALADEINQSNGGLQKSDNLRSIWLDAGWYLLALPLICCLLFFRKGILVVVFVMMSANARAGFFLNDNQEGLKAFNNQEYAKAAAEFKDKNWQGASWYRAGDYQKAFSAYQNDGSAEGLYNQGNALAKGGKIDEAITKYEKVLELAPNHEDAKFNLEYLKKQKQNRQQQKLDENQNQNGENQEQQQQQNQQPEDGSSEQNRQNQDEPSEGDNQSEQQRQDLKSSKPDSGKQDVNSDSEDNHDEEERQNASENELDKNEQGNEGREQSGTVTGQGDDKEEYDEKMQAKMQQYRDIPEDPGGLLKAFIEQEYRQNRYNEE